MALTGYNQKYIRRNGGLKNIALINIDSIENASLNSEQNAYTEITLAEGSGFAKYRFFEDEAEFTETVTRTNGALVVTHTISFALDKMGGATSAIIEELARESQNGLAAIVTTVNDDSFLVGYSPEFKKEYPLRLVSITGESGRQLSDPTRETIILRSEDISKAKPFTGETENLYL